MENVIPFIVGAGLVVLFVIALIAVAVLSTTAKLKMEQR